MPSNTSRCRRVPRAVNWILILSVTLNPLACSEYSGPSEYQQLMAKQDGFSGVISAAGGTAVKEGKAMFGFEMAGWLIELPNAKISDELLASIIDVGQMDPVFKLNLSGSTITDAQLAQLDTGKVLQKMVDLNLSKTAITDAGLAKLSNFYCITELDLTGSKATKQGATKLGSKQIANPNTPNPFRKQPNLKI